MVEGSAPPEPRYLQIVAEIRDRIASGELRAGERVPSARQITREWGVAIATATKVLATLRQEELVRAVSGIGTVVAAGEPRPAARTRSPRRRKLSESEQEINRDRVVRVAVAVADAEGLASLSMRRVASELGAATMSLYRYVSSKEELIQQMVEAVLGEAVFPDPAPPGWRTRLELVARLQWAGYRRHPWLAQVISFTRPPIVSNALVYAEWTLGALDGLGLDANTMLHIQVTLANHVRGTAVNLEQEAQFQQDTGLTDDQWLDSEGAAAMSIALASSPFPRFADLMARPDLELTLDTLFDFGLGRLLDGIGVLIEQQAGHRSSVG
jgi:DNA-binding transcriptional regulator YhcF (GntR family)